MGLLFKLYSTIFNYNYLNPETNVDVVEEEIDEEWDDGKRTWMVLQYSFYSLS